MEKSRLGLVSAVIGIAIFLVSLFIVLPLSGIFYVPSLFGMFAGIVMIAVGVALSKGMEQSLGIENEKCYYCNGSGKVNTETCPRCGGTGISPDED
jgi:hypothetical protein